MKKALFNIKISNKIRKKFLNLINSKGGIENFSRYLKTNPYNVKNWLNGKNSLPFKVLKEIALFNKENIEDILNDEILTYERSNRSFRFKKKIQENEANFLGWLLSEGTIEKEKRINISQYNKICLINLQNNLKKQSNIDSKIVKDHEGWKLRINNAAFTSYLLWRYNLKIGRKYDTVRIPEIIFELDDKQKFSFLAGYLEGDGCFSHYWRNNKRTRYKVPRIFITSSSRKILVDISKLYESFGIISKINKDRKSTNPKWSNTHKLNVTKIKDCLKLAFNIQNYLIHPEKKERLKQIFKDHEIINCIRINNRGPIQKLIEKLNIKRKDLPDYLQKNLNYKTFESTINGWINGRHRPPLSFVLHSYGVLGENYKNLPKEFSFLFKVQKINAFGICKNTKPFKREKNSLDRY